MNAFELKEYILQALAEGDKIELKNVEDNTDTEITILVESSYGKKYKIKIEEVS